MNIANLMLMTKFQRLKAMKPREMSRAERLYEIRQWFTKVVRGDPHALDLDSFRRYSETKFLLEEVDLLVAELGTHETRIVEAKKPVDPADFTETIALEPGAFNNNLPANPPALPAPERVVPVQPTETELVNSTVMRCQIAAERALVEASRLRLDMYALKGAVQRAIMECRRPPDWSEPFH